MSEQTDALIDTVPTLRLGRKRTLHRYKLDIVNNRVVILTRCDINVDDQEFEVTHGIPTCDDCEAAK